MEQRIIRNSGIIAALIGLILGSIPILPILVFSVYTQLGNIFLVFSLEKFLPHSLYLIGFLVFVFAFLLWYTGRLSAKAFISKRSRVMERSTVMAAVTNTAIFAILFICILINTLMTLSSANIVTLITMLAVLTGIYLYNMFISLFTIYPLINFIIKKYVSSKLKN